MSTNSTHLHISEKYVTATPGAGNGETLPTRGYGVVYYDPNGASRTGVILEAGIEDGQIVRVVNIADAAETITFDTSATSNVAGGAAISVANYTSKEFVWNNTAELWF